MCNYYLSLFSMDGHLDLVYILAVVDRSAFYIGDSYLFNILILFPLEIYAGVGLPSHMAIIYLIFEVFHTILHNNYTNLTF